MIPAPPLRIIVVAALAVAALIGLVVHENLARAQGTEVLLRMEAVDPRALLTGHFVAIELGEVIPMGQACPPGSRTDETPRLQDWVALARSGDHHAAVGAAPDRAAAARFAPLLVRGQAVCTAPTPPNGDDPGGAGMLHLKLGIERFYISQSEAQRIDAIEMRRHVGESPVLAIVSIGQDGQARLKGLSVEGQRVELSLF